MKNYEQDPQRRSGNSPEIRGNVVKPAGPSETVIRRLGSAAVKGAQGKR